MMNAPDLPPSLSPSNARRRGVVAVVVRDLRFLVIRRSAAVVAPRMYCFPGGGIEQGESEEDALVREFDEELGAVVRPERQIWQSTTPWGVELAWWLGTLDESQALVPNPAEVESFRWLRCEEMQVLENLLESNHQFLRALAAGTVRIA